MCLAIPAKIVSIEGLIAKVDMIGNERSVGIHMIPDAQLGDYVLVHAGFAIEIIDNAIAKETEELLLEELHVREKWERNQKQSN